MGDSGSPPPGTAARESGPVRFHLAVQTSRAIVYGCSIVLALVFVRLGALRSTDRDIAIVGGLALVSAFVFRLLYVRGLGQRAPLPLHAIWMPMDVALITWGVHVTGGASSPWFIFYLSNLAGAAFVAGRTTVALVGFGNSAAYLALLLWTGEIRGLNETFYLPLLRVAFLHASALFFVGGILNLKEKRRLIQELQAEQASRLEELLRLTKELAGANVRIQEADRMKSQFLANMSHELRTPLNAIIGFSDILLGASGEVAAKQQRFLQNINSSGQHLLGLINDILDLSKIEAGRMEAYPEMVRVRPVAEGVVAIMHGVASKRGISFAVDVPEGLPAIETDPGKLEQILYNLVSNAVKFSPDGSTVTVRATHQAEVGSPLGVDSLAFEVIDRGIGITPSDQTIVFQEFRQAEETAGRRFGGTGLGLALVKRLVELQGGRVDLVSEVETGSTFTVTLPLRLSAVAPVQPSEEERTSRARVR